MNLILGGVLIKKGLNTLGEYPIRQFKTIFSSQCF